MTDPTPAARGERSVAVGDNRGLVATGDGARVTVLPSDALRSAVSDEGAQGLNNLRALDSTVFEGRADALSRLATLPSSGTGIVSQSVRGMGGVGKTTLVLRHARRQLAAGLAPVWWITADSAEAITNGLAELTSRVHPTPGLLSADQAAQWAVTWLQGRTGWLLVLDNVEDPAHLSPYLGALGTGQVLVTTRRDLAWQDLGTTLCLDTLTPEASVAVLRGVTGRSGAADTAALTALAEELGHLPLALQQAGAYVRQTRTSVGAYLARLREDPAGVLADTAPGDPHQRTVAQVWGVTLSAVREADPHAADLLAILAHCAPDPLPRRVLAPVLRTPEAVDRALGVLAAYSMVSLTETNVTVHRLVQSVLRAATPPPTTPPPPGRIRRLLRRTPPAAPPHPRTTVVSLLDRALPSGDPAEVDNWLAWAALLSHIEAAVTHHRGSEGGLTLGRLLGRAAIHLGARGQARAALPLQRRSLAITEAMLDPDHPVTGRRLNNLALALGRLGRHTEALPLQERALRITEAVLGPDHPTTGLRLNNLASQLSELGRHAEALPLHERAVTITEAALGPDHPTTATTLGNLASALGELGRYAEALPLQERALRITEANLGPDHPTTGSRRGNLASTLGELGRYAEALPLQERALTIAEAVLGPDHPTTGVHLNNLASMLGELGRPAEALPLTQRALTIIGAALGSDHPTIATPLDNLALTLGELGRPAEALPLQERAVFIIEAAFGPDHPDTGRRLKNLAATLEQLGRHAEARTLNERASAIAGTTHVDHPGTGLRPGSLVRLRRVLPEDEDGGGP